MARPLTITAFGNAQVDTAESKSGGASALFDGSGDYLLVSNSNYDLDTTSDWTIEFWFYLINPGSGVNQDFTVFDGSNVYNAGGDTRYRCQINCNADNSVDHRFATQSIDGTGDLDLISGEISKADTVDSWNHVAITRSGTTLKYYFNGQLKKTNSSAVYSDLSIQEAGLGTDLQIGAATDGAGSKVHGWNGWIDEFRISNSLRYSGNFTPAIRFVPDTNTMFLMHADGTDGSTTFTDDAGVQGQANLTASFTIVEADGRTYIRNTIELAPAVTELSATAVENPSMVFLGNDVYTWDDLDTWDSKYLNDDRWVVWEILPSEFLVTVDGTNSKFAQSTIDAQFDIIIDGERLVGGSADLAVTFELAAAGIDLDLASADLTASTELSATAGLQLATASAELATSFTLEATALNLDIAASLLAFDFQTTARGGTIQTATADLNTAFTLQATALNLDIAAALLAFDFQTTVNGGILHDAQVDLSVSTEFTAQGDKFIVGQAQLDLAFDITVDADNFNIAAALLAFDFATTARAGLILEPNELFDYTWDTVPDDSWDTFLKDSWEARGVFQDSRFSLLPLGGLLQDGQANLTALATELAVGERLPGGSADLDLEFTLTARPTLIPAVLPFDLPVTTELDATADLFVGGTANLQGLATQLTVGDRLPGGSADLEVNTAMSVFGGSVFNARAALEVFGFQFSEGRLSDVRGSANLSFNFDAVFAGDLRLLPSELVYKILPDSREWSVLGETRLQPVYTETRYLGNPSDRTAKTVTALGGAAITDTISKFGDYSMQISNIGDYITISGDQQYMKTDFTVEMWLNASNLTSIPNGVIWDARTTASNGLYVYVSYGSIGLYEGISGKGLVNAGWINAAWNHVAFVRNNNNFKVFVNGQEKISATVTTTNYSNRTTYIGSTYAGGSPMRSYYDEVRLSYGVRYSQTFTPTSNSFNNDFATAALLHFEDQYQDDNLADTRFKSEFTIPEESTTLMILPESRVLEVEEIDA